MAILNLFRGGGQRRRSDRNWDKLEQKLSSAERELGTVKGQLADAEFRAKHMDGAYRYECQAPDRTLRHPAMWVYSPHRIPCPWCRIRSLEEGLRIAAEQNAGLTKQFEASDAERQRLERLMGEDAGLPGTEPVPAPVDNGCRDTPATTAETQRDLSLLQLARPGEEHMAAELDAMRASNLTTTVTLPVIPDRPAVPDPAEQALNIPAPHPFASATAIPKTAIDNAVTKVHALMTTASTND